MDKLLDSINSPSDIKHFKMSELRQLAQEIREYIIDTTCKTGGHVAPSLGAVEISIALHYVFNTPDDKIVWDVGHQSYAHKILTERKAVFRQLRTYKGISGFNNIFESPHDSLTVGHAGTSMSAALGMAAARDLKGEKFHVVNVIGDGSMTNGLVYEAMNNIAHLRPKMLIILNDNKMSISENVGGISQYLNKLETTPAYTTIKKEMWELLGVLPDRMSIRARDLARRMKESLKNFLIPTILFEEFGIRYIGPIDGHDINDLIDTMKRIKEYDGPILIHAITQKGRGYKHAENDPTKFHGLGKYCVETGKAETKANGNIKYTNVFGQTLVKLAEKDERIVGITAAMPDGTGLSYFRDAFPKRFFDVGIAEGHAVEFSVGLALQGLKPVCAIYSTFLQRAYDQLIQDAALMRQNVFFILDRGGIVGEDGPTHHGVFDLSYLRTVPKLAVMAPKDEQELRSMLKAGIDYNDGPVAMRYPRGEGVGINIDNEIIDIEWGKSEIMCTGNDGLVIAIGSEVYPALEAVEKLKKDLNKSMTLVNLRFLKPFDEETLLPLLKSHELIITVEENALAGGMGDMINSFISSKHLLKRIINIGIKDEFIEVGSQEQLRKDIGLDSNGIYKTIKEELI